MMDEYSLSLSDVILLLSHSLDVHLLKLHLAHPAAYTLLYLMELYIVDPSFMSVLF